MSDVRSPDVVVREAIPGDNDALITLELECPLEMGDISETYNRAPDFFACHRQKEICRVVVGEIDGRIVGVMTGAIQSPLIAGERREIMYVQQARVHPDFHGRKVAWHMANSLFAWAGAQGASGPYYLISPRNAPSIAFVERGGGRWPIDVSILSIDPGGAAGPSPGGIADSMFGDAADLVNETHAGQDFFELLTADTLAARSRWAPLYGVTRDSSVVAVAGFWDRGAATERLQMDRTNGTVTRSREAAVTNWGWAPGHESAFTALLSALAANARTLGRSSLTICEPLPGAVPMPDLDWRRTAIALFTPALTPPAPEAINGIFIDMLYI